MNDYVNYYDLLGVTKTASPEEIKKAYIKQVKKWHPDLNKDEKAEEITKKINEAKEILLDAEKRKEYDLSLEQNINEPYENLRKKNNKTTYNNETQNKEEKLYTKWEYFKLYLKYYKATKIRKILAIILVLIETIICGIMQGINYFLAYFIVYLYGLIKDVMIYCLGGYVLYFIVKCVSDQKLPESILEWIIPISIVLITSLLILSLPYIPNFLISKVSVKISKLNINLFKISIGYNN